jgi:tetratricopeptide (TPR) repeat protein
MRLSCWRSVIRLPSFLLILLLAGDKGTAQKRLSCPDGDHFEIDIQKIRIQYEASSFAGTLSSLSVLAARLEVAPKKLQEAAVATQQWDEFLKGLAAGYNSCAVTRQQYADGLNHIYPRLKEDAANLEEIRKVLSEGRRADEKRLQNLLESYYNNLRQFVQISGKDIILERIEALSAQVVTGKAEILQQQKTDTEKILDKLAELEKNTKQAPLPPPAEVNTEIRKSLLAKAGQAEAAYKKGYDLLNRFRFQEAIPHLRQAIADVPLPEFYLALGRAYSEVPDLQQAEKILGQGLTVLKGEDDEKAESQLSSQLGIVLHHKGDLEGALSYAQRALKIVEKVYGPNHPEVAIRANNIGQVLRDKGDLKGALSYTQRALKIDEKAFGPGHPTVATDANNIGMILQAQGDLEGALSYTQRALKIDEKAFGPDHPTVATDANNIGQILQDQGDLEGALSYTQRALKIDEKVFGPDHPEVAIRANNIGQVLRDKGDLKGALSYAQRALKIDEKVFGPDHPTVAIRANNIGVILKDKGDLEAALSYTQRALKIDEKAFGPDHPKVATDANNIGQILQSQGDLEGALSYTQRALKILQNSYGPDNPVTKTVAANLEQIKHAKQE